MSFLEELENTLVSLVPADERPVVIFSAMWPVLREMGRNDSTAVGEVLDLLVRLFRTRSLLMPTFSEGYNHMGVCNLDTEPSSTGVLSEYFRQYPGVTRTLSAWFSYAVLGGCADEVVTLLPEHAWGDHSLYYWMEERDTCFIMLGTHFTHCSYLHRLEWLVRDVLPYRFCKTISGTLIRSGQTMACTETLYVRSREPVEAVNDFTTLLPFLQAAGMRHKKVRGVSLAVYDACAVRDTILPILRRDPLMFLKNRINYGSESREIK